MPEAVRRVVLGWVRRGLVNGGWDHIERSMEGGWEVAGLLSEGNWTTGANKGFFWTQYFGDGTFGTDVVGLGCLGGAGCIC